jgi:hypothetical protein
MKLPTKHEINPEGDSYDGQGAVDHFLGKTREQITKEWAGFGESYREDLSAMGPQAFCFYLPAVVDYVTTDAIRDDSDTVGDLCSVIETRLEYKGPEIRQVIPEIVRLADYVLAHSQELRLAEDSWGDMRPRWEAIKRDCAELAVLSSPSLWKRRKVPKLLESVCRLLPAPSKEASGAFQNLLTQYRECIESARLERALDILQELGDLVPCRGGYWRNLERAAEAMDLADRIPYLRRRFEQTGKRAHEP